MQPMFKNMLSMHMIKKLTILAMIISLAACSTGPRVESDYDASFNFASVKTYLLEGGITESEGIGTALSLADQRMIRAIEHEMSLRGIEPVAKSAKPDIKLAYHITSKEKTRIRDYNFQVGYGLYRYPFGIGYHHDLDVDQYTQGTLLIDAIDPASNRVVWRGTGTKRMSEQWARDQTPERIKEYVGAVMSEMPIHIVGGHSHSH